MALNGKKNPLTTTQAAELAEFVNSSSQTDSQLLRRIQSLSISADAKALLADLLKITARVAGALLRIGRKILDFVLNLLRQFPHIGFAALIALVVGALVSLVPIVGALLSAVVTPLGLAFGIVWGASIELSSDDLGDRVRSFVDGFSGLNA